MWEQETVSWSEYIKERKNMDKNKNSENVVKEKDPRFRKIQITKNLNTNVVNYNINGFGNPVDIDTLWGFIDNECNPQLIKQRIVASFQQKQQQQNKLGSVEGVKDAEEQERVSGQDEA